MPKLAERIAIKCCDVFVSGLLLHYIFHISKNFTLTLFPLSPPHELPHRDPIQSAVDEFFCPKLLLCCEIG